MKNLLEIPRIASLPSSAADVVDVLDSLHVDFHSIDTVNWPNEYPCCPDAAFRIAWCPDGFLLHYKVTEQYVRARYKEDNSDVWTDSCVECFIRNVDTDSYFNIECNCIGTILVGMGAVGNRCRLTQDEMALVQRWSSLGDVPFEERSDIASWEVALIVPYALFARQPLRLEAGATLCANFYKCGDELSVPHYISWAPIEAEKPNFHRPDCFGKMVLS